MQEYKDRKCAKCGNHDFDPPKKAVGVSKTWVCPSCTEGTVLQHTYRTKHYEFVFGPHVGRDTKVGTVCITNNEGKCFHVMTQELLEFVCETWVKPGVKRDKTERVQIAAHKIDDEHNDFLHDLFGYYGGKPCT